MIGDSFDEFLKEEGIHTTTTSTAVKRVIGYLIEEEMEKQSISRTIMAEKMGTSRAALDRLLNPKSGAVTLNTLVNAANSLGKKLRITLE